MLRDVIVEHKATGHPVNVPAEVSESKLDQYVKRFIEIAAANPQDGSGVVSLFRSFHGGPWTMRILQEVLKELRHSSINLDISRPREDLVPFFEWLLQEHTNSDDADFGYPNHDPSKLPL